MMLQSPWWLVASLFIPVLIWYSQRIETAGFRFPSVKGLESLMPRGRFNRQMLPFLLRMAALFLIIAALARPRQGLEQARQRTEGIDIVLVVDVSTSMLAEDFQLQGHRVNRLSVVKDVVREFVAHRPDDRIGLVVFGGRPYTQCPLTLDHGWLLQRLGQVKIGMVEDGTAIGSGIATGLNRLRRSPAKSRILIVLTDGVNNAGMVTPEAAADLAKALHVKIYTIGAGTKGMAPYPVTDMFGRRMYHPVKIEVDDEGLTRIAQTTSGLYFRATDAESLKKIYDQIDAMEKTRIEQPHFLNYKEWYPVLVLPALQLVILELVLSQTWLRVLP